MVPSSHAPLATVGNDRFVIGMPVISILIDRPVFHQITKSALVAVQKVPASVPYHPAIAPVSWEDSKRISVMLIRHSLLHERERAPVKA